jgi:hypothetical protein
MPQRHRADRTSLAIIIGYVRARTCRYRLMRMAADLRKDRSADPLHCPLRSRTICDRRHRHEMSRVIRFSPLVAPTTTKQGERSYPPPRMYRWRLWSGSQQPARRNPRRVVYTATQRSNERLRRLRRDPRATRLLAGRERQQLDRRSGSHGSHGTRPMYRSSCIRVRDSSSGPIIGSARLIGLASIGAEIERMERPKNGFLPKNSAQPLCSDSPR